jgi:hypothetical protein
MSADCSLQVVESQHRSGDLILANDRPPGNRLAKRSLRGLSVLQQDFQGPQRVRFLSTSSDPQMLCIGQVENSSHHRQTNWKARSSATPPGPRKPCTLRFKEG